MAQGMRKIGPKIVMDALSAATNQSVVVDVGDVSSITLLFKWDTGSSLSGEFFVDGLFRAIGVDGATADEFVVLSVSPSLTVSGVTGQKDAVLTGDIRKIRVRYVATAGTGNMSVSYNATSRG